MYVYVCISQRRQPKHFVKFLGEFKKEEIIGRKTENEL
jgi:hypothetical protein